MSMIKEWLYQLLGHYYTWMAVRYRQIQTYSYSLFHPYHYDADRYGDSFLEEPCEFAYSNNLVKHIERVIYIFWTGDNEITPNRMEGIHSLEKVCGVKVQLITPKNLPDYIKQDDPLPEAYQYLSFVHRADYLRTYFMYHYGGGYADIKPTSASWIRAFNTLECSDMYAIGYPEIGFMGVANQNIKDSTLKRDLLCLYLSPLYSFYRSMVCRNKKARY